METIHLFVELLDQYFSNVCEVNVVILIVWINSTESSLLQLDIVFHFNRVYSILDEYLLAGEVQETNKNVILDRMRELEKLE